MLRSKELRIGNLVNIKCGIFEDAEFENCVIGFMELNEIHQKHREWIEYKPIPLTEEWLLKFGFEETEQDLDVGKLYKFNDFYDYRFYPNGELMIEDSTGLNINDCDIKYIHQLQNLYFALTGEELQVID